MTLEDSLAAAVEITRQAGQIALTHFRQSALSFKGDGSEVTNADIAVDRFFKERIAQLFPLDSYGSEEIAAVTSDLFTKGRTWVVDPIDGTRAFAQGLPTWSLSVALFEETAPVLGIVYLPTTGDIYTAIRSGGAFLAERRLMPAAAATKRHGFLVPSNFHRRYECSYPGKVRGFASTSAHLAFTASGAAAGALIYDICLWDIAAGALLIKEAGLALEHLDDGSPVELSDYFGGARIKKPLLAGAPETLAEMRKHLHSRH